VLTLFWKYAPLISLHCYWSFVLIPCWKLCENFLTQVKNLKARH
jgi:hypothetical protein